MLVTIITLVDNTDLSVPGKGQQARTYELYSRVARKAEVRLVTHSVRNRERLLWASQIVTIVTPPERLAAWIGGPDALPKLIAAAKGSDLIVVEHTYGIERWSPIAAKILGLPLVYDSHGNEAEVCKNLKCKASIIPFERNIYRSADAVVAISEAVWSEAARLYGIDMKRHLILTPGLKEIKCGDRKFRDRLKSWGVSRDETIAVMHGSLDYGPNVEALKLLIEITKEARKKYNLVFVIAGASRNLRPGWLSDSVLYVGFVEDLDDFLCSADVAVSLNVSGSGVHMKVIDYLSAGLPLVATPKSLEGLPIEALRGYPLKLAKPPKDDVVKVVVELAELRRGPFSGKANLPTWDEQAERLVRFLSNV